MPRTTTSLAVLALLAAGVLVGCGADDAEPGPSDSTSTGATPTAGAATLELTLPAAPAGRCMAPNVENLQAQDTAFEGVVTAVDDDMATLQVEQSFKGDDVQTVSVALPSQELADALLAVDFQVDQTYLVSSLDGQVSVCGLSAPKDDLLTGLYDEAYAG
ncbi:hypothetical protein [Nocardioides currus]|uniref:Uncharacterized protein n=1 Tax=Nocardioides currus TaxID=2133958 RepID=A0A2R7YZ94_9ACTN|nr:hypothetical protein [Nocardioides currus]PUA81634.1 hypothetical protein C7S10_06050 [Nocardioides currus]